MTKQILVIGSGFAGVMSALGAARLRHERGAAASDLAITVVSPEPSLVIRPRLYEPRPETMTAPLTALFQATGIDHLRGQVAGIDAQASQVTVIGTDGRDSVRPYDRLIIAAGSAGVQPPIPGLAEFGFSANHLDQAVVLDRHLHTLAVRPDSAARNTVVVCGAGFTGLEVATEMPDRLRSILGPKTGIRVIVVDRGAHVAATMGEQARPYIEARLAALGIETRLGASVASLDQEQVLLDTGERIASATVIWCGGMRASPLTAQLQAERDATGRILVEPDLRVPGNPKVFATGDTAKVATDGQGHFTLMSCQHARRLGAFAGHNAAADLLGVPTLPYDQPSYVTCLDLGADDAIVTRGWSSQVELTGSKAKAMKQEVNTLWIYPPAAEAMAAFENVLTARTLDF